jgi:hypothetical protein
MKTRRLPNPESEPEMVAHMASAKRTARLFIGRRLRCRSSGDGLHGPYDFDLDHRTATCRVCRRADRRVRVHARTRGRCGMLGRRL